MEEKPELPSNLTGNWAEIIRVISKPISIYSLALLITYSFLSIVIIFSDLAIDKKWIGFKMMFWLFVGIIIVITLLVTFKSEALVSSEKTIIEKEKIELEKFKILNPITGQDSA